METCCCIVGVIIAICVIYSIYEDSEQKEQEKKKKIESFKSSYQYNREEFERDLECFFNSYQNNMYETSFGHFLSQMENHLNNMKSCNRDLKPLTNNDVYGKDIKKYTTLLNKFKGSAQRWDSFSINKMMNESNYGTINTSYWNTMCSLTKAQADSIISQCEKYKNLKSYLSLMSADVDAILKCIWFYAASKPFSAQSFSRAVAVFRYFVKRDHTDIVIAELYAKNQMGGDNVVQENVRKMIKDFHYINKDMQLTSIASSLMWMKAYNSEKTVLQYMLDNGVQMPVKAQERLHSLANGGGKAPNIYNAKTSSNFDVSSIGWSDADFNNFFDNLSFQEKKLTYSLAMRDEDKNLLISSPINLPDNIEIANILNAKFSYEYGNVVKATSKNFIALSGSGKENIPGILIQSKECKHMAILVHISRIGKKLSIKFYTLFMPVGATANDQKQLAISLFKKLSPTASNWESSMKDSVLLIIQQILNSSTQTQPKTHTPNNDGETYL